MKSKLMKIMIIEDDIEDCIKLKECVNNRNDIELVAVTDSDVKGIKLVKEKRPEGIILDLELNNSNDGNADSLDFIPKLKRLKLGYEPIIIVTTHINSKRIHERLHRDGADLILFKGQPNFSYDIVLNRFISLRQDSEDINSQSVEEELEESQNKISDYIDHELELVGISPKMVGRGYLHNAILYLIEHPNNEEGVNQYLTKIYKKAPNTISNGMQNAITHAWRCTAIEDLEENYTAKINVNTGVPTPTEFICYYRDKIKRKI